MHCLLTYFAIKLGANRKWMQVTFTFRTINKSYIEWFFFGKIKKNKFIQNRKWYLRSLAVMFSPRLVCKKVFLWDHPQQVIHKQLNLLAPPPPKNPTDHKVKVTWKTKIGKFWHIYVLPCILSHTVIDSHDLPFILISISSFFPLFFLLGYTS